MNFSLLTIGKYFSLIFTTGKLKRTSLFSTPKFTSCDTKFMNTHERQLFIIKYFRSIVFLLNIIYSSEKPPVLLPVHVLFADC